MADPETVRLSGIRSREIIPEYEEDVMAEQRGGKDITDRTQGEPEIRGGERPSDWVGPQPPIHEEPPPAKLQAEEISELDL